MLNKPLNIAHAKDRQVQKCIKKGLFDSAINIERNIVENLEKALRDSENPLAVQSIQLQKTRHLATISRLEKEIEVRDRARRCVIVTEIPGTDMTDIPHFGGKSAPVLSASSCLPSNASEKDRMILRLQDKVSILTSQLEECKTENSKLRERIKELERTQSLHATQLLSPHSSSYHHIPPSTSESHLADPPSAPEDVFSLTPLEKPPLMDFKW